MYGLLTGFLNFCKAHNLSSAAFAQGSGNQTDEWIRPTVDTPICVGRCSVAAQPDGHQPPAWLCPKQGPGVEHKGLM